MAVSASFYANFFKSLLNKELDFDTDVIKCMLCTASHTPNVATHQYKSSVTNEVAASGSYAAGGVTLGSATVVVTAANSWATQRANATAYDVGVVVRPATGNGFLYQASVAGTSGGSVPTFPTVIGATVADGGVTWTCLGRAAIVLDANDIAITGATITARYGVIYDSSPASDATRPLIALIDFGADMSSTAGPFNVTFDAQGIAILVTQ